MNNHKFKKGDFVRFLVRANIPFHRDDLSRYEDGWHYGIIIDFPIDGESWAQLRMPDGTKTTVFAKDLEKPYEQP